MRDFRLQVAATLAFVFVGAIAATDTARLVTPETYSRAETDRSFNNIQMQAGGINKFFKIRKPTPLDQQTVVRMNKDTLYSAAIVDTSKGATITIPKMPGAATFRSSWSTTTITLPASSISPVSTSCRPTPNIWQRWCASSC